MLVVPTAYKTTLAWKLECLQEWYLFCISDSHICVYHQPKSHMATVYTVIYPPLPTTHIYGDTTISTEHNILYYKSTSEHVGPSFSATVELYCVLMPGEWGEGVLSLLTFALLSIRLSSLGSRVRLPRHLEESKLAGEEGNKIPLWPACFFLEWLQWGRFYSLFSATSLVFFPDSCLHTGMREQRPQRRRRGGVVGEDGLSHHWRFPSSSPFGVSSWEWPDVHKHYWTMALSTVLEHGIYTTLGNSAQKSHRWHAKRATCGSWVTE